MRRPRGSAAAQGAPAALGGGWGGRRREEPAGSRPPRRASAGGSARQAGAGPGCPGPHLPVPAVSWEGKSEPPVPPQATGTMTFQWTAVAAFLYGEIGVILVLCLPFISPLR